MRVLILSLIFTSNFVHAETNLGVIKDLFHNKELPVVVCGSTCLDLNLNPRGCINKNVEEILKQDSEKISFEVLGSLSTGDGIVCMTIKKK
jgi:hypothetical protein